MKNTMSIKKHRFLLTVLLQFAIILMLGLTLTLIPKINSLARPLFQPTTVILYPPPNTHTVVLTTAVSIEYDEDIDPSTVTSQTFAVYGMQTGLLVDTPSVVNNNTIILTPSEPFHPGELVQVSATTGTLNITGTAPLSPTIWQFRAGVAGGSGVFVDSSQALGNNRVFGVALGDLDGDGDLDAVTGASFQGCTVWLNDGQGIFSAYGPLLGSGDSYRISLGDLNGDTYLDIFVAKLGSGDQIWFNDGTATFTLTQTLPDGYTTQAAMGDVDGDGNLDLVTANPFASFNSRVWFNDGQGYFTEANTVILDNADSRSVELGDVDNDGDLDIFMANYNQPNRVWFNVNGNTFTPGPDLGSSSAAHVVLGDLNSDGSLDAFISNNFDNDEVWLNDGTGVFTVTAQTLSGADSTYVALGDLDADNDLDAFITVDYEQPDIVWLNDGTGIFTDSGQSLETHYSLAVALGDLNGDGDLDAFVGIEGPDQVWFNKNQLDLTLTKTVTPTALQPGQWLTYTLIYTNNSDKRATSVSITDLVPSYITAYTYTATPPVNNSGGSDYTWDVGLLEAGQSGMIILTGQLIDGLAADFVFTNTATIIDPATIDFTPANNIGQAAVTVLNSGPIAYDSTYTATEGINPGLSVVAMDPNGDSLTYTELDSEISFPTATNPAFNYLPPNRTADYTKIFSFTVTESHPDQLSDSGTVTITVSAIDDAPVVFDVISTTFETNSLNGTRNTLDYDPDVDGGIINYTLNAAVGNYGVATMDQLDGSWVYTPANRLNPYTDTFDVIAEDNGGNFGYATMTVTVTVIDDAPIVIDSSYQITEDDTLVTTTIAYDPDEDGGIASYGITTYPATGTLTDNGGGGWTYTPDNLTASYQVTFTLTVTDTTGNTTSAIMTIDVTADNENPIATDNTFYVEPNSTANSLDVLADDTDLDTNTALTISEVGVTSDGGTVNINSTNDGLVYTPTVDFTGIETFTYTITDGELTDTALVIVEVTALPDIIITATVAANTGDISVVPLQDIVTYTVILSNIGQGDATNVVISHTAPSGLTFGGIVQPKLNRQQITEILTHSVSISAGMQYMLSFTATVNSDYNLYGQTITNIISFSGDKGISGSSEPVAFTVAPLMFKSNPITKTHVNQAYNYNIVALGGIDVSLIITATVAPPAGGSLIISPATLNQTWLRLTDNGDGTAQLYGTPAKGDEGEHQVTLIVANGPAQETQSFTITVLPPAVHLPIIFK